MATEVAVLLVLPTPVKSLQNGAGLSRKVDHTGPAEKERVVLVPQRELLARTLQLAFLKGKRAIHSYQKMLRKERVQVGKNCTLVRKRRVRARA